MSIIIYMNLVRLVMLASISLLVGGCLYGGDGNLSIDMRNDKGNIIHCSSGTFGGYGSKLSAIKSVGNCVFLCRKAGFKEVYNQVELKGIGDYYYDEFGKENVPAVCVEGLR